MLQVKMFGTARRLSDMSASLSHSPPLIICLLAVSLVFACGGVFDDADAHNEQASGSGTSSVDEAPGDDDDDAPDVYTSTSNGAPGSSDSNSNSGAGSSTGDPDDPDNPPTDADADARPMIMQAEVQGTHAPEPITAAGPVALSVFALDDMGIERVDFFVGDQKVASVTDHDFGHYAYTLAIDHQDDAGELEFYAVAVDSAGQTATSDAVAFTVALPESGAVVVHEPNQPFPGEHVYWEDVAVSPTGELFIVGFRLKDGVTTMLSERRGPGGSLIDDQWIAPTQGRYGVAVTFMGSTPIVVARDVDGSSWITRYTASGSKMYLYTQDDVEWRDVAVSDELVFVVGNTGVFGVTDTVARTWTMTPTLTPLWVQTETEGGDKNTARAVAVADGRVFAVGQVTYNDLPGEFGAAWAYAAQDGAPHWSRVFTKEAEDILDVAVLPDGLRTAGFWYVDEGRRMLVRHLQVEDGVGVPIDLLEQTAEVERAYALAVSSHGEYVIAGAECENGECFAQSRRYAGDTKKWQELSGLKSPVTRFVAAKPAEYGYVVLLGQHDVNYGNGLQGSSWLHVVHP